MYVKEATTHYKTSMNKVYLYSQLKKKKWFPIGTANHRFFFIEIGP